MILDSALTLYLEALRRRGRSPATLDSYGRYLRKYLLFLADEHGLAEPTLQDLNLPLVEQAQDWIRARAMGRRDGAIAEKAFVVRIRGFARFLWRRGFFEIDPLARMVNPSVPKLHRIPFSESEVRGLVYAAGVGPNPLMERALLLLGMDTGARIGELCAATVHDLDLDLGAILFRVTKTKRPRRVIFAVKNHQGGGPCLAALRLWLAVRQARPGVDALFVTPDGKALQPRDARRIYTGLAHTSGVEDCYPHKMRHTHASELLAALPGAEIQLRHRLGHVSPEILADYITVSDPLAQTVADAASLSVKWGL